ncbi:hypothetical protein O59_002820 [Cellvibrio sp. BR]|nr:hypothetical protein O59_002820 [Cellvibrio sp. BR]
MATIDLINPGEWCGEGYEGERRVGHFTASGCRQSGGG